MPALLHCQFRHLDRSAGLKPTLLQYVTGWSPLLPPAAAAVTGWATTRARRWIVIWCLTVLLWEILAMLLGASGRNNLWLGYVGHPFITAALLWALSEWHPRKAAALALKAAIPLVVLVSVALTLTLDDPRSFSLVVTPFHSIVMLLAAVWTFVNLSLDARTSIIREDWFWIIGGLMAYAATATAMQPLAWYLIQERVDLLHAAFNVRAAVVLLSFAAITWGMLSRGTRRFSGGSSSPPSSPSSSSSAG